MKVGVLTSSRADFGIYIPLLKILEKDSFFDLEIIAFGTHLSKNYGFTFSEIEAFNFNKTHKLHTIPASNSPEDITKAIGNTIINFSIFWSKNSYDLVFALGDRYEIFAAVSSLSLLNAKIAHIHAGETTLGAVDNSYRHAISLFSKYLFVSTEKYKKRAENIVEKDVEVYNVGALSIDNLKKIAYLSVEDFFSKFKIDLGKPTILTTFHPETISFTKNQEHITELLESLKFLKRKYQIIITLPNADTMGQMIRNKISDFAKKNSEIKVIESFGVIGYLSCMKYCKFLLGNSSSGFVEAAFFPKPVINLGNRQKGRLETENILTIPVNKNAILKTVKKLEKKSSFNNCNKYGEGNTAEKIISILKKI